MNDNKALAPIDQNVFLAFDRLDDDQIIQEMKGAALTEYVYEFTSGGKTVRGLSKSGTDDASRFMAVKYGEILREVDSWLEKEDVEAGYFKALVKRFMVNQKDGSTVEMDSAIGHKRQPKKDQYGKVNQFWYEQGGQKALRNAKQKLIPETIKLAVIASYVEAGKVRKVKTEDIVNPSASKPMEAPRPTAVPSTGVVDNPETIEEQARRQALVAQITADMAQAMVSAEQLRKDAEKKDGVSNWEYASLPYLEKLAKWLYAQAEAKQRVQANNPPPEDGE